MLNRCVEIRAESAYGCSMSPDLIQLLITCASIGLLLWAAVHDLRTYEIPDWISIALAALGLVALFARGAAWGEIGLVVGCAAATFAGLAVLFFLGWMGGGDVKLISATMIAVGAGGLLPFAFYMALAGAVLCLALIAARRLTPANVIAPAPAWIKALLDRKAGVPYAVAICAGGIAALAGLGQ